ncbi:MAG: hypothetical protein JWM11_7868 [Planctomycetaceae bacterium]|nr:hypothetical protein [Planctomycetaceae bacterium]
MADINGLSIAELEKLINSRKSVLTGLYSRRDHLARQMDAINAEIAAAEGSAGTGSRGRPGQFSRPVSAAPRKAPSAAVTRAQNEKSLKAYVIDVLTANRRGLTLNEIQEAVLKVGYITNSANFKNTLYQCLYHNEDLFVLDKQTKCYKLGK